MQLSDDTLDVFLQDADPAQTPLFSSRDKRAVALRDQIMASPSITSAQRRTGRRWKAALSLVLAAGIVGGGTWAVAGDGNETPWGWIADSVFRVSDDDGSVCFHGVEVRADGVPEDAPIMVDAAALLREIDVDSLDIHDMVEQLRDEYATATDLEGNPAPIVKSGSEIRRSAIVRLISQVVFDGLREKGYGPGQLPVHVYGQSNCGG